MILSVSQAMPLHLFLKTHFTQNLREQMRAWGQSTLWGFVFILPGLVRWIRYLFVPFIVSLDPAYARGEKDALQESRRLSRGSFFQLCTLFLGLSLMAPVFLALFDDHRLLWQTPMSALLLCFVEMLINLWLVQLLYRLYEKGARHESALSME
jgi:hypothetical protein